MSRFLSGLCVIVLSLVGLATVTFVVGRFLPADPVLAVIGDHAPQDSYERTRLAMGLDRSIPEQFLAYLSHLARFDLGMSLLTGRPVLDDLASFFPATWELATAALLIGIGLGVPTGIWAAARRGQPIDHVIRFFSLTGYAIPVFWLGLVGLVFLYVKLDLVPGPGRISIAYQYSLPIHSGLMLLDTLQDGDWDAFLDAAAHLLLPAGILGFYSAAYVSRMTRSLTIDALEHEFITTAWVKGAPEWRVLYLHALPTVAGPLIMVIALAYAGLLEGAVLTETVFAWPGLGLYVTNALFSADLNAVLGATLVVGACFLLLNMGAEALQRRLDPQASRR